MEFRGESAAVGTLRHAMSQAMENEHSVRSGPKTTEDAGRVEVTRRPRLSGLIPAGHRMTKEGGEDGLPDLPVHNFVILHRRGGKPLTKFL